VTNISPAVAFVAIMSAAMPAAYAQTRVMSEAPAPVSDRGSPLSDRGSALGIQPDQTRASKIIGSNVYDVHNRDIGSVKDLVLDRDGKVVEVVVVVGSFFGVGGKYVAVGLSDIKKHHNQLTVDLSKEQLQQMAEYHLQNQDTGAGTMTSPAMGEKPGH
jgi:sporulation protein YlmC with PRC-barrel domain